MLSPRHQVRALVGVFLLLGLAACDEAEPAAEKPRPVRTVTAGPVAIDDEVVQTGEIRPHVETDLGFRIDGRLVRRDVDVGAIVARGDPVATLDDSNVASELRSAEADLASAVASEDLAKSATDRQHLLFDKKIVAQARIDEADANWRSATAKRSSAAAALEIARNKLGYTRLTTTEDGIVTAIGANPGQVVTAGQMVARIASARERDAVFNVSEKIINSGLAETPIEVRLVSDPTVVVVGHVRDVSPSADPTTRSYRVRVALPEAPGAMTFGATVSGRVLQSAGNQIALPAAALTSDEGRPAVFVVDRVTNRLSRKTVTVARYTASEIFVTSGLGVGDEVVTAGVSKLRPGQTVAREGVVK